MTKLRFKNKNIWNTKDVNLKWRKLRFKYKKIDCQKYEVLLTLEADEQYIWQTVQAMAGKENLKLIEMAQQFEH